MNLFFMCGIQIDLVLGSGSKLICFFVGGSKSTSVLCASRIYLVLVYGSKLCVRAENYLFLIYGSRLTGFLCAGRTLLVFSVEID